MIREDYDTKKEGVCVFLQGQRCLACLFHEVKPAPQWLLGAWPVEGWTIVAVDKVVFVFIIFHTEEHISSRPRRMALGSLITLTQTRWFGSDDWLFECEGIRTRCPLTRICQKVAHGTKCIPKRVGIICNTGTRFMRRKTFMLYVCVCVGERELERLQMLRESIKWKHYCAKKNVS